MRYPAPYPAVEAPSIVLAEDDPAISEMLADMLAAAGYEVARAGSASRLYHLVMQQLVDLVLLDVRIPGGRGWSAVDEVVARSPQTRVVVISEAFNPLWARTRRPAGFLEKPFRRADVLASVREALTG